MVVSAKSRFKSIDDIIKAKRIKAGFSGAGSDDYYGMILAGRALGFKVETVTGYKGANEANLAGVKGEVEAVQSSYRTMRPLIESKDVIPVLVFGEKRLTELPNVPTVFEVGSGDSKKVMEALLTVFQMERAMFAPPGVPAGKVKVLREALGKAVADPDFKKDSEKNRRPVEFLTGGKVEEMIKQLKGVEGVLKPQVMDIAKTVGQG